ncbi:MAG: TadE/TadG family type IV pilus assembly protein [Acidimicrobiales bacterium]
MMRRSQTGSAGVVEIVLLTPLFMLVAMFIVEIGRIEGARTNVAYAAHAAARAAAQRSSGDAAADATAVATATLAGEGITCTHLRVVTDTSDLLPAGTAKVTVSCTTGFADLGPLHLSDTTLSASAVDVVDTVRGGP